MGKKEKAGDAARTAGRGFLVITGAKAWFFLSASILNFGLPLLFKSPADYGTYGLVINAVSVLNMVVITGTLQAVSKLVSEDPSAVRAVLRRATLLQAAIGLSLAAGYALLAGPIASWLKDDSYVSLLRLSALVVVAYSFYAIYIGALNGLKEFTRQATLDIIFATFRTGFILAAVAVGLGVMGAIIGFVVAAIVILALAMYWVYKYLRQQGIGPSVAVIDSKRLAFFLLSTMFYTFLLNMVIRIDLFLVKRFAAQAIESDTQAAFVSNSMAGAYNLMLNIARVPYQAVIAIAFVIFPMLSQSTFESDLEKTRGYVRDTMRYTLLIVGLFASVLAGAGADVVRPMYPDYAYASDSLLVLCVAYALFALLYVGTTMLIAAGRPWVASLLTIGSALILIAACLVLVDGAELGVPMLNQAALAVLIAMVAGLAGTGIFFKKSYGGFIATKSALRLTALIAIVTAIGHFTRFDHFVNFGDLSPFNSTEGVGQVARSMLGSRMKWLTLAGGKAVGLGVAYLALLFVSGELGPDDKARVKRVFSRKKKAATTAH